VTAAPVAAVAAFAKMPRLLAASLVLTVMTVGMTPCAALTVSRPASGHDCCDHSPVGAAATDLAAPSLAAGPAACCLVMPGAQPATFELTATTPSAGREAASTVAVAFYPHVRAVATPHAIDLRGRSSPRSPLVTVLLI
jgi:hypothetical protein